MIFDLYWAPEGRCIQTVEAKDEKRARRMIQQPYRKFLGEVYALEVIDLGMPCNCEPICPRHGRGHSR
jgi:hypothetical protein